MHPALAHDTTVRMIVCVCNNLSDRRLRAAAAAECGATPGALFRAMGCRPRCGRCLPEMRKLAQAGEAEARARAADPAALVSGRSEEAA